VQPVNHQAQTCTLKLALDVHLLHHVVAMQYDGEFPPGRAGERATASRSEQMASKRGNKNATKATSKTTLTGKACVMHLLCKMTFGGVKKSQIPLFY
jgi:hypothetical protein